MALTITNVDLGSVILKNAQHRDDVITFAGADTFAEGTILARDSVSGKMVLFVKGGATNENGIPKAVLTYDITLAAGGDSPARVMVSGEVRKERLIIDADGDDTNVDAAVIDQLRDYGIVAVNVSDLSVLDNQ